MIPLATIQASSFMNPGGLTTQEIQDQMDHKNGTSIIDYSFRLLDNKLNPVNVPGAPASDPAELPVGFVKGASIEMNTTRDVHRQMTLDLVELPGLTYNPLFHRVQPYCDFYDGSYTYDASNNAIGATGTRILHIPRGIFMGILPDRDLSDQYPLWHLTLYDETYALQQTNFLNTYTVSAGSNLISTAITLLELALLPPSQGGSATTPAGCDMAGFAIPASRISIPPSSKTSPVDIVFTPNDTLLSAVNTLLKAGNEPYWPLYQDEFGVFTSSKIPYFTTDQPQPGWTYDTARNGAVIINPPVKQSFTDQSALANCVKVYSEHTANDAYSATVYNTDLRSAISIPNLGRVVTKVVVDDNLGSDSDANTRASIELQLAAALQDTVEWDAVVVPVHQVHDGLTITIRGQGQATYTGSGRSIAASFSDGPILVSSTNGPFLEISWSEDCTTRMAHHAAGAQVAI